MGQGTSLLDTFSSQQKQSIGLFDMAVGQNKTTGASVTLFTCSIVDDTIVHSLHLLKTLRHPGIIKFLAGDVLQCILLVTEPVTRLEASEMSSDEILVGLYSLLEAVQFLHQHHLYHQFITSDSIYITKEKKWVLGSFEYLSNTLTDTELYRLYAPPSFQPLSPVDRDLFGIKQIIKEYAPPQFNTRVEQCTSLNEISDLFLELPVIQIISFIDNIRAKDVGEKYSFFSTLAPKLADMPHQQYTLGRLLNASLFSEPGSIYFYSQLFRKNDLVGDLYPQVLDFLKELYSSTDFNVRSTLLVCTEAYAPILTEMDWLIQELLSGLEEQDPLIYYPSLSSLMICVVPYLSKPGKFSVKYLIENVIIKHIIVMVIQEPTEMWSVLSEFCKLFKLLIPFSITVIQNCVRSLSKAIQIMFRILSSKHKVEFMFLLVGNLEMHDPGMDQWIPFVVEVLVPLLKDDSQMIRKQALKSIMALCSNMTNITEKAPFVSRKRNANNLIEKLQKTYSVDRKSSKFIRSGPRPSPTERNRGISLSSMDSQLSVSLSIESDLSERLSRKSFDEKHISRSLIHSTRQELGKRVKVIPMPIKKPLIPTESKLDQDYLCSSDDEDVDLAHVHL